MDQPAWTETVLGQLGLPEKVSLLSGADFWRTRAIADAGVPTLTVTDGPNGAIGQHQQPRISSASFPSGSALGATWDRALVAEVGSALAAEARTKCAQLLLAPTVNLHRTPLAGRNFECYSEDPHLTAELAVAFIQGVQGAGVGACVKHFVANDSEFERTTISSEVDERTLREVYLVPFERTVAEADVWAVMGAYNRVNGTYACAHRELLINLLKEEWGFDGAVISDWFALQDTESSANGGTDLEMPGPGQFFGDALVAAVRAGAVDEAVIDDKVRRVLRLVQRCGLLDGQAPGTPAEPCAVDLPEHRALARRAAVAGIVLLKNEPAGAGPDRALPLERGHRGDGNMRRLAVIGPNAGDGAFQGGGSSQVVPHYVVQAVDAITARAGDDWKVIHEPSTPNDRFEPEPDRRWFRPLDEHDRGLLLEYFDGDLPVGEPVSSRLVPWATHEWTEPPPGITDPHRFAARWTGHLSPEIHGRWRFGLAAVGRARLFLDDVEIVDNWTAPEAGDFHFGRGSREVTGAVEIEAGRSHQLRIELSRSPVPGPAAVRVGMAPAPVADAFERAVAAAEQADVAVVVVGTSAEWESEGFDRPSMALPGDQDELVRQVAAVNDRTIVVVNTGSPIEMPWADEVPAIVQLWFAGQELGNALTDVLFGDAEPGGRLPVTFPVRYRDHPALFGYPGERGKVRYGEGVFMGYRGYLARDLAPRFPFGHGLSYTTFSHRNLHVELVGDPGTLGGPHDPAEARRSPAVAEVRVEVINTGDRPGTEVVQLFVGPPKGPLARPPLELKSFAKVDLAAGESRTVTLALDARAFSAYDPAVPGWRTEPGAHQIVVASSGRPVLETTLKLPVPIVLPVR